MTQAKKVDIAAAMLIVASARAERGTGVLRRTATRSPKNPTISLADDVATTKRIIDAQTAAAT